MDRPSVAVRATADRRMPIRCAAAPSSMGAGIVDQSTASRLGCWVIGAVSESLLDEAGWLLLALLVALLLVNLVLTARRAKRRIA